MFDPLPDRTDTVRVELGERSYDILIGSAMLPEVVPRMSPVSWA